MMAEAPPSGLLEGEHCLSWAGGWSMQTLSLGASPQVQRTSGSPRCARAMWGLKARCRAQLWICSPLLAGSMLRQAGQSSQQRDLPGNLISFLIPGGSDGKESA